MVIELLSHWLLSHSKNEPVLKRLPQKGPTPGGGSASALAATLLFSERNKELDPDGPLKNLIPTG